MIINKIDALKGFMPQHEGIALQKWSAIFSKHGSVVEIGTYGGKSSLYLASGAKKNDQIVFKYCDENSVISDESNPNGSCLNIAGIINKKKNIIGMMPHPERCTESILGGTDGTGIFQSLIN